MEQKHISLANCPWLVSQNLETEEQELSKDKEKVVTSLVDIPFHVLETIMERCVGMEYMNFRATSKLCHLAAPLIQWSHGKRLQSYSLVSPWLMEFDMRKGIITFTDPMSGHNYFITNKLQESIYYNRICCSRYGWVLFYIGPKRLVLYNPFTSDIRKLHFMPYYLENLSFSAPPTSPDCMVAGFTAKGYLCLYLVNQKVLTWRIYRLKEIFPGSALYSYRSPTYSGGDLYTFCKESGIEIFEGLIDGHGFWEHPKTEPLTSSCTSSAQYLLAVCNQHTLLVVMGEFGESIELFQPKDGGNQWEEIHCLGNHMIYVCDSTCICVEAKIPEMKNKIYFSRLHPENGKMVFYSLETRRYHTFNGKTVHGNFRDLLETKQYVNPHAWIEPSWC